MKKILETFSVLFFAISLYGGEPLVKGLYCLAWRSHLKMFWFKYSLNPRCWNHNGTLRNTLPSGLLGLQTSVEAALSLKAGPQLQLKANIIDQKCAKLRFYCNWVVWPHANIWEAEMQMKSNFKSLMHNVCPWAFELCNCLQPVSFLTPQIF